MAVIRPVVTLLLALAFQLVQVLPVAAAAAPCPAHATACDCGCDGGSCPCAKESAPVQQPQPAPLSTGDTLKPDPIRPADTAVRVTSIGTSPPAAGTLATPPAGLPVGFHGVSLAVAFCSFVI